MFAVSFLLVIFPIFSSTNQIVSSSICNSVTPPSFTTQNTTTTASTDIISGTTSSGVSVSIYDNSQAAGSLTSDSSGNFSLQVSLNLGSNSFSATAANNCQSVSSSTDLVIIRQASPSTPSSSPSSSPSSTPSSTVSSSSSASTSSTLSTSTPTTTTTPSSGQAFLQLQVPGSAFSSSGIFTTANSVFISGSTNPGAQVVILDNHKTVAQVTAANDGSFGVSVPLSVGINNITINSTYNGKTTTQSITYIRGAPQPKSTHKTWLYIILAIVIIALGGLMSLFILKKRNHQNTSGPTNEIS
jgi:hypothetical protein